MISIVVPIYNEEYMLCKAFTQVHRLSRMAEMIFVDGGSTDRSVEMISEFGTLLHSDKGRARQMNMGGRRAQGDILLFMHADTNISPDTLPAIEEAVNRGGYIGGCLTQKIDKRALIYRFIEAQGNSRARRHNIFYGDQGIFVRKDAFEKLGGFPEVPIMEDVLFSKNLRDTGKTVVLPDQILVSPRRWEKYGILRSTFLYNLILLLFRLKVPLNKIKQLYEDIR